MHALSQNDTSLDQWKGQTASEKQAVLSTFLKECGELASWEVWLDFLN